MAVHSRSMVAMSNVSPLACLWIRSTMLPTCPIRPLTSVMSAMRSGLLGR